MIPRDRIGVLSVQCVTCLQIGLEPVKISIRDQLLLKA